MTALVVRSAEEADLPALNDLYNHYVEATPATFDVRSSTLEERRLWFRRFSRSGRHQLWVALRDGDFVGYACSHSFRAKDAY